MPEYLVEESDSFGFDEAETDRVTPIRFDGSDSVDLSTDTGDGRNLFLHGIDIWTLHEVDTNLSMHFPQRFTDSNTLTLTDDGEITFSIRTLVGSDSIGFTDNFNLNNSGYAVAALDGIGFSEIYGLIVDSPTTKSGSDSVAFTDSSTVSKAKGKADGLGLGEDFCLCWTFNRTTSDTLALGERHTIRLNGKRIPVTGTLPGTGGASFKAIIVWDAVDEIKFVDFGTPVDDDGNPLPDYSCCNPRPVTIVSWATLESWASLTSWGGLVE